MAQEFTKPSLTVPGQSISVSELQRRYIAGTLPDIAHNVEKDDEDFDGLDFSELSVFDAYELSREYDDRMRSYLKKKKEEKMLEDEQALYAKLKEKYGTSETNE